MPSSSIFPATAESFPPLPAAIVFFFSPFFPPFSVEGRPSAAEMYPFCSTPRSGTSAKPRRSLREPASQSNTCAREWEGGKSEMQCRV